MVRYFFPNVTSLKQPCDLRVIAAVKKRYKLLLLKDVLSFYRLDNVNQQLLKEKGSKVRRGSVIVCYAMTDVNLDAANYTKEE